MDQQTLKRDFGAALAPFTSDGDIGSFFNFFADNAIVQMEDVPFLLDKTALKDQVAFVAEHMESLKWVLHRPEYKTFGTTGIVSADLAIRGKPKSSGFRQRHCVLTAVCAWDADANKWRGLSLHTSTLDAHIHHASPG